MTSVLEEKPNTVESGAVFEKNEADLVLEVKRAQEKMWQARSAWDNLRSSKTVNNITQEDIIIRDDWRTKKDQFIALLQTLSDDISFSVDLTPPSEKIVSEVELTAKGGAENIDWAGETIIRSNDDKTEAVEVGSKSKAKPDDAKLEVDTSLKLGPMAGRDYTNMTMEEIDAMIFNAKATAKSTHDTGIADEGLSLWKEQKRLKQEAEDEARKKTKVEVKRIQAKEKEAEKLAKEKKEAEARAKRVEEIKTALAKLYHEIWNKKQELENAVQNFKRSKNYNIMESAGWEADETRLKGELTGLEIQKKDLEKELAKLEKGVGSSFRDRFKEAYEKSKKLTFFGEEGSEVTATGEPKPAEIEIRKPEEMPVSPPPKVESVRSEAKPEQLEQERAKKKFSLWKWTKERVKTFFKDGGLFGEFVQAETMRRGTGHAANSAEALSTLIKTEWNINNPDAVQDIVNEALKTEKKTGISMDSKMIEEIAGKRKEVNDDEKNYIIKDAVENLKRNLAKARGQATSESVLSPENLVQVEAEMKKEMDKISDAALVKDVKGFAKVMRDNMDKYWWLRYLYGGAELAALAGLGYYALAGKEAVTLPNVAKPRIFMPESLKPVGVPDDIRLMVDHYWGVAKGLLSEHGITNPNDGQIMEVTKVLAKDNNVAVPPWGIEGDKLHTKLPIHWVLVKGAASFIIRSYL